jgi:hypothetical protein
MDIGKTEQFRLGIEGASEHYAHDQGEQKADRHLVNCPPEFLLGKLRKV